MKKYKIYGGVKLKGQIKISGAKNSALKIISAALLASTPSVIKNVPDILDIRRLLEIISKLGVKLSFSNNTLKIDPSSINSYCLDTKLTRQLRGSIVLAGPLLSKFGKVVFSQPGGCYIGIRSINDHLDVFSQFGIKIKNTKDNYELSGIPKPCQVVLPKMSVSATENAIMSSVLSSGVSNIHVAAAEPEIADLAHFLNKMGAKISGAGTHDIQITGVKSLKGTEYFIMPDRIEAGTYLCAAIATNSSLKIGPVVSDHLSIVIKKLRDAGAKFTINNGIISTYESKNIIANNIDTRTYPGFPTDLQSVYTVLMTQAIGKTRIFETLFESRFGYIDEIKKMSAKVSIKSPHIIVINGPVKLKGANISSSDIRGGAALVIAGLIASGTTTIDNVEQIERGYDSMVEKLNKVGARIEIIE